MLQEEQLEEPRGPLEEGKRLGEDSLDEGPLT